jgi:hypothetical protein
MLNPIKAETDTANDSYYSYSYYYNNSHQHLTSTSTTAPPDNTHLFVPQEKRIKYNENNYNYNYYDYNASFDCNPAPVQQHDQQQQIQCNNNYYNTTSSNYLTPFSFNSNDCSNDSSNFSYTSGNSLSTTSSNETSFSNCLSAHSHNTPISTYDNSGYDYLQNISNDTCYNENRHFPHFDLSQELENVDEANLISSSKEEAGALPLVNQLKFQFEDNALWESFNKIGTEMIANRNGRFIVFFLYFIIQIKTNFRKNAFELFKLWWGGGGGMLTEPLKVIVFLSD